MRSRKALEQRGRSTGQRKAGAGCVRLCATFSLLSTPSPHKPRRIQSGARLARFFSVSKKTPIQKIGKVVKWFAEGAAGLVLKAPSKTGKLVVLGGKINQ